MVTTSTIKILNKPNYIISKKKQTNNENTIPHLNLNGTSIYLHDFKYFGMNF